MLTHLTGNRQLLTRSPKGTLSQPRVPILFPLYTHSQTVIIPVCLSSCMGSFSAPSFKMLSAALYVLPSYSIMAVSLLHSPLFSLNSLHTLYVFLFILPPSSFLSLQPLLHFPKKPFFLVFHSKISTSACT